MSVYDQLGVRPPNSVVTSKLRNAGRPTVTMLVEAGFDQRFWQMHVHDWCRVEHQGQGGRQAALAKLDEARGHPDAHLIAVLDADLDRVNGCLQIREDVFWTDAHDLETTLLGLEILEKLVRQRVGVERLRLAEEAWAESVRKRLFRHAEGMGRVRWYMLGEGGGVLAFKKGRPDGKGRAGVSLFDEYARCAGPRWEPSLEHVLDALIRYHNAQKLLAQKRELLSSIAALPVAAVEQVCNGHDLVGFLHAWLRYEVECFSESVEVLADALALGTEHVWLQSTAMWRAIRDWEAAHPGFFVLKPDAPSAVT